MSLYKLPEGMSFAEGAAFPIIYPTSYAGLVFRANLQPGEDLLVHAAAMGTGGLHSSDEKDKLRRLLKRLQGVIDGHA